MELDCPVQQYHWGKKGSESLVAILKHNGNPNFKINDSEPYAELWMGTHPNGAAFVKKYNITLEDWITQHPTVLGQVQNMFGNNLPFLFKILSVRMPLSVQVHPSKETAAKLHLEYPQIYKDPNHKPELAVALTDFEALCGFRPFHEIVNFFRIVPELACLIGNDVATKFSRSDETKRKIYLKKCFTSLMTASNEDVKKQLDLLVERVNSMKENAKNLVLGSLLERIYHYFPNDVGCFCIYFFNFLILKPGEAIFLDANEPHAYISGDCIECMACSDNVIRAGLTPKFRDVNTLCDIINYDFSDATSKILNSQNMNENCVIYKPPVQEFAVCKLSIQPGEDCSLKRNSPSILVILEGSANVGIIKVAKGQIFFLSANEELTIKVPSFTEPLILYQAFVNI